MLCLASASGRGSFGEMRSERKDREVEGHAKRELHPDEHSTSTPPIPAPPPPPYCINNAIWNDTVAETEDCDDGDGSWGNGCTPKCHVTSGWYCFNTNGKKSDCIKVICGDGIRYPPENCDDGSNDGIGCALGCGLNATGWQCTHTADGVNSTSTCIPIPGDGLVRGNEECDDGNLINLDGCTATMTMEAGWTFSFTEPTVCTEICGDNRVVGDETCDDANSFDG